MSDEQNAKAPGPSRRIRSLRSRAEAYLHGPRIISEPGASLARLIARYVAGESFNDPERQNLLSDSIRTAHTEAAKFQDAETGPERDAWLFYQNSGALLQEIQAEAAGDDK